MSQCTYVDGRYEPNEMFALAGLLRPGMTFVDVGANEGIFTLLAARLVGPGGAVHAFEPSPRERERLRANLELNRLANVTVHAEALGAAPGEAVLGVSTAERPGHNTIGGFAYEDTVPAYEVEIAVTTLDAVGLERADVIKVDVEGSETAVLRGARATLATLRPTLIVEAQDASLRRQGSSAAELLDVLRSSGYEIEVFGESGAPEPLEAGAALNGQNLLCRPGSG